MAVRVVDALEMVDITASKQASGMVMRGFGAAGPRTHSSSKR